MCSSDSVDSCDDTTVYTVVTLQQCTRLWRYNNVHGCDGTKMYTVMTLR